jgi:hypothetical protein
MTHDTPKPSEPTSEACRVCHGTGMMETMDNHRSLHWVKCPQGCEEPTGGRCSDDTTSRRMAWLRARVAELEGLNASLTEDVADLQREKNNAGALAMEYMRERDDARAQVAKLKAELDETQECFEDEMDRATRAEAQLRKYGVHDERCWWAGMHIEYTNDRKPCTCGLDAVVGKYGEAT